MIEIIQAGQFGKTLSLIEMHKLRKKIFKDRMGWDVDITTDGLEVDNYDLPETVYILVRDDQERVVGVWRMLPSSSPSMIRDIWPEFLNNFSMPVKDTAWEVSRFGVYSFETGSRDHIKQVNKTTAMLISALMEVCVLSDISEIYTLYNPQVGRSVRRIGFIPEDTTDEMPVDGKPTIVGRFRTDVSARDRIRRKTGITCNITVADLPPILQERVTGNDTIEHREVAHG